MISAFLSLLFTIFLYALLGTTMVLGLVMSGVAIWWWRKAASPLAVWNLALALFFIGYAVRVFLHPTFIEVLVLAVLVVFSLEVVMESADSKQPPN